MTQKDETNNFRSIRTKLITIILLTVMVPVVVIVILFTMRFDSIRNYSMQATSKSIIENRKAAMSEVADSQAENIRMKMKALADEAAMLAGQYQAAYTRSETQQPLVNILKDPAGEFYGDLNPDTDGDLYVSGNNQLTPQVLHDITTLHEMTPMLKQIAGQHPEAVYTYVVTKDSIVRGFPAAAPIPDVVKEGILDPFSDFREYPFFYVADSAHNPKREVKWTDVYFDPGGNGWMFSVCAPVYIGDEMKAVAALDITTEQIIGDLLAVNTKAIGYTFLVKDDGTVLGFQKDAAGDMGWNDKMKPDEIRLTNPKRQLLAAALPKIKDKESVFVNIGQDKTSRFVYMHRIASTPFIVGMAISEDQLLAPLKATDRTISDLIAGLTMTMVFISLLILLISLIAAFFFSSRITSPILELASKAGRIARGDFNQTIDIKGNDEITRLANDFNAMAWSLQARTLEQEKLTAELTEKNRQLDANNQNLSQTINKLTEAEEISQHYRALSYTDDLTGVFNRRYFEEHFEGEFTGRRKNRFSYACLLLDVDDFKSINDTYGHVAGDEALRVVAEILLKNKRFYDVVARFGGDEFVMLMGQVEAQEAHQIAARIRAIVSATDLTFEGKSIPLTVSIGVTAHSPIQDRNAQEIIQEADWALYRAKATGGNKVAVFTGKLDETPTAGKPSHSS